MFAEAQPRVKRSKQTHTRVAEVEKKLDNIFALLQHNQSPSSSESPNEPVESVDSIAPQPPPVAFPTPESRPAEVIPSFQAQRPPANDVNAWTDIVPLDKAQEFLNVYRTQCHSFPFLCVPTYASVQTLSSERPFFFLSVLYMGSYRETAFQRPLDDHLRKVLSSKIIVDGEISMDILQGLLVFLAWYHFCFRPARSQIHQFVQLAASMADDLALDKPGRKPSTNFLSRSVETPFALMQFPYSESEIKRTYLGCYCLTSAYAILSVVQILPLTTIVLACLCESPKS